MQFGLAIARRAVAIGSQDTSAEAGRGARSRLGCQLSRGIDREPYLLAAITSFWRRRGHQDANPRPPGHPAPPAW